MTESLTGPELFKQSVAHLRDVIDPTAVDMTDEEMDQHLKIAQVYATQAQTAAIVMLVDAMTDHVWELDGWRAVIPLPPRKES